MLDESTPTTDHDTTNPTTGDTGSPDASAPDGTPRKRTAKKSADPAKKAAAKKSAKKATKKAAAAEPDGAPGATTEDGGPAAPAKKAAKRAAKKTAAKRAAAADPAVDPAAAPAAAASVAGGAGMVLFQAPDPTVAPPRKRAKRAAPSTDQAPTDQAPTDQAPTDQAPTDQAPTDQAPADQPPAGAADREAGSGADGDGGPGAEGPRKRRRRGGRGRRGGGGADGAVDGAADSAPDRAADRAGDERGDGEPGDEREGAEGGGDEGIGGEGESSSSRRRRRRRRRSGADGDVAPGPDDPPNTVVRVRERRPRTDEIAGVRGSTRLEAKKQRRREGREQGRRKQVITEAEFLARRESVERVMVVRQTGGRTQIGVLEDDVLVEHYVSRDAGASMAGNVYLGRVQNVLPSMEAAFVDIGKGRNAVLYAGEVNWDVAGLSGQAKRIENVLKSGESVLVQVTKDPIGHKGARLTSQVSLPGRYLVYVPQGSMTGISRKLPENERTRLKQILKAVLPEGAGVIVRTAAEGASEDELRRDVERLTQQWEEIQAGAAGSASAPALLHGEPDLTVRVIRDVFNEDFAGLVVSGPEAWNTVDSYVGQVAPDLSERVSQWTAEEDVFTRYRIDEQLAKALDRKVWLPSGGSLVIDRTEAMTVVDVNTGKFTGSGGNLEETVTKNNIEAAEEIVRQLRLRDVGGIIVIDFIDMVLESNRELVLRRLLECLGRDRTKHQVAEVTSLGLVQMTRKRVGQGLLEVFSETCEACHGRGIIVHTDPVEKKSPSEAPSGSAGKGNARRGGRKVAEPPPVRTGPTAAEIAARAHAAAMHNAKAAEAEGAEAQDAEAQAAEPNTGAASPAEPHGSEILVELEQPAQPEVQPEPPLDAEPEVQPEPPVDAEPEVQPEPPVDAEPQPPATADPAPAPRRRRGRVTAPAGPPRTPAAGD